MTMGRKWPCEGDHSIVSVHVDFEVTQEYLVMSFEHVFNLFISHMTLKCLLLPFEIYFHRNIVHVCLYPVKAG